MSASDDLTWVKQLADDIISNRFGPSTTSTTKVVEDDGRFYVVGFPHTRMVNLLIGAGRTPVEAQEQCQYLIEQMIENHKRRMKG